LGLNPFLPFFKVSQTKYFKLTANTSGTIQIPNNRNWLIIGGYCEGGGGNASSIKIVAQGGAIQNYILYLSGTDNASFYPMGYLSSQNADKTGNMQSLPIPVEGGKGFYLEYSIGLGSGAGLILVEYDPNQELNISGSFEQKPFTLPSPVLVRVVNK